MTTWRLLRSERPVDLAADAEEGAALEGTVEGRTFVDAEEPKSDARLPCYRVEPAP